MATRGNVRIYIRVSTKEQTIERQEHIIEDKKIRILYCLCLSRTNVWSNRFKA